MAEPKKQKIRPLRAKLQTLDSLQVSVLKVLRKTAKRILCTQPHLQTVTDAEFVEKVIDPLIYAVECDRAYRAEQSVVAVVAEARKQFELSMSKHVSPYAADPFKRSAGKTQSYTWNMIEVCWISYCTALEIDPVGDHV